MGGTALLQKGINTRRHNADEFNSKKELIIEKLRSFIETVYPSLIPTDILGMGLMMPLEGYRSKETFGDLDVLITVELLNLIKANQDKAKEILGYTDFILNGTVLSFDFQELQVDLIAVYYYQFDYAYGYFSSGDFGNLAGKLLRQMGLKHSHTGLYLPIREENGNLITDMLLTTVHREALDLIGLDYKVYEAGFDTVEDIYRFAQSSKYFNPKYYQYENISAKGRIRDRKRKFYKDFLEFNKQYTGPVYDETSEHYRPRHEFFHELIEQFQCQDLYKEIMSKYILHREAHKKFNGLQVSILTGLINKELGKFMTFLRKDSTFDDVYVVHHTQRVLDEMIMDRFKKYSTQKI